MRCEEVQQTLLNASSPDVTLDPNSQHHFNECSVCQDFARALRDDLPEHFSRHNVSDAVVAETLRAIQGERVTPTLPVVQSRRQRWASLIALAFVTLAFAQLFPKLDSLVAVNKTPAVYASPPPLLPSNIEPQAEDFADSSSPRGPTSIQESLKSRTLNEDPQRRKQDAPDAASARSDLDSSFGTNGKRVAQDRVLSLDDHSLGFASAESGSGRRNAESDHRAKERPQPQAPPDSPVASEDAARAESLRMQRQEFQRKREENEVHNQTQYEKKRQSERTSNPSAMAKAQQEATPSAEPLDRSSLDYSTVNWELAELKKTVPGNNDSTAELTAGVDSGAAPESGMDQPAARFAQRKDMERRRASEIATLEQRRIGEKRKITFDDKSQRALNEERAITQDEAIRTRSYDGEIQSGLTDAPGPNASAGMSLQQGMASLDSSFDRTAAEAAAKEFLDRLDSFAGLSFKDSTGYWSNTYLPGDPDIRLLESRLQSWDRAAITAALIQNGVLRQNGVLEKTATQYRQPFDKPENAALAVFMRSDKAAVNGPARMRLQVGLQASDRQSGHRPNMNFCVVLALNPATIGQRLAEVKALLFALLNAKQPGDNFSVIATGHGILIAPGEFRFGTLQLALEQITRPRPATHVVSKHDTITASLESTLFRANETVKQHDNPNGVLGTSGLVLITDQPVGDGYDRIKQSVHRNAVNGVALHALAIGTAANFEELDQLVLAGQGHRYSVTSVDSAARAVDKTLLAASRAVAHAVRLRIRLARGVQLINVIGSERLDEVAAQRVRDAERSIDQRMARNLGIRADRGDDEDGIQIVIPSYFAGDSHTILLDVVVPQAGPIADVTVRYKDLLYLRNAVVRSNLTLESGHKPSGPLEENVLKNLMAVELANAARSAATHLANERFEQAKYELEKIYLLYQGMRNTVPGWPQDQELVQDSQLLSSYLAILRQDQNPEWVPLADSLRLAAHRKLLTTTNPIDNVGEP